ncbi:MAG: hypothetical protein ABEL51_03750 [Salinibacter sp.]
MTFAEAVDGVAGLSLGGGTSFKVCVVRRLILMGVTVLRFGGTLRLFPVEPVERVSATAATVLLAEKKIYFLEELHDLVDGLP